MTTLAAAGPGSLQEALAAQGPRVVEFAVAGTIDLGGRSVRLTSPFLTIAGETAPHPGITITNGGIQITTHDLIVRHIRVRPGAGNRAKGSGWEVDGLATGDGAHDVIVDHCSLTWATDENLSASGVPFKGRTPDEWRRNASHRVTFSNCIIGEGLDDSTHAKGPHSKGTLVHDNASEIAIIGNLYISNADRNPLFKAGVRAALVNNVIHNPGQRVVQFGYVSSQWAGHELQRAALSMAGNVVRQGPSSAPEMAFFEIWPESGSCDFYLADNLFFDPAGRPRAAGLGARDRTRFRDGFTRPLPGGSGYEYPLVPYEPSAEMRQVEAPPVWPPRLKARPAAETVAWVVANAGARPWDRDATDRRLIEETRTGGGAVINEEPEGEARITRNRTP
ncbi:MAG: hypothetical protein JNG82_10645 [Opitutaceae bacterium]|nr:hypothetical protein [Opitutaceae bacterium]